MSKKIEYTAETRFAEYPENTAGQVYVILLENGKTIYESALIDYDDFYNVVHDSDPVEYTLSFAEEIYLDMMRWCINGVNPEVRHHRKTYWRKTL